MMADSKVTIPKPLAAKVISATTLLTLMEVKVERWFDLQGSGYICKSCGRVFHWIPAQGRPLIALVNHVALHEREGREEVT